MHYYWINTIQARCNLDHRSNLLIQAYHWYQSDLNIYAYTCMYELKGTSLIDTYCMLYQIESLFAVQELLALTILENHRLALNSFAINTVITISKFTNWNRSSSSNCIDTRDFCATRYCKYGSVEEVPATEPIFIIQSMMSGESAQCNWMCYSTTNVSNLCIGIICTSSCTLCTIKWGRSLTRPSLSHSTSTSATSTTSTPPARNLNSKF